MSDNHDLDLDAHHYESNSESQYKWAKELIGPIKIQQTDSILDVGCGHGNIIAELSKIASEGKSVGIDASLNMIDLAMKKFPKSKYPNLEFFHEKAEDMHFEENTFDIVICANVLLWVKDAKMALELMCKYLKPGGALLILTYPNDTPYALIFDKVVKEYFPSFKNVSAANTMLSIEQHKEILISNNIELDTFLTKEIFFEYCNVDELKDYVKGWLHCYIPLPENLYELFLEKLAQESLAVNISSNKDEIKILHKSLTIRGKKKN